jgi:hypothetical protein
MPENPAVPNVYDEKNGQIPSIRAPRRAVSHTTCGKVRFRWKDYRNSHKQRTITLDAVEFLRRFLLHVFPKGFVHIPYYRPLTIAVNGWPLLLV